MNNIDNKKYEKYRKYISTLVFIEIFNPLLKPILNATFMH